MNICLDSIRFALNCYLPRYNMTRTTAGCIWQFHNFVESIMTSVCSATLSHTARWYKQLAVWHFLKIEKTVLQSPSFSSWPYLCYLSIRTLLNPQHLKRVQSVTEGWQRPRRTREMSFSAWLLFVVQPIKSEAKFSGSAIMECTRLTETCECACMEWTSRPWLECSFWWSLLSSHRETCDWMSVF